MKQKRLSYLDLSFLIPIRIDSDQRLENLKVITDYIIKHLKTNLIVLEASSSSALPRKVLDPSIKIVSIDDHDIIFHRTKYLNILTRLAKTPFVAIWDADVLTPINQISEAMNLLRGSVSDFVIPYDGRFMDTGIKNRKLFFESKNITILEESIPKMGLPYGLNACGGGFIANKSIYLKSGLENENFYGWGSEDGERVKRWEILDFHVRRVQGPMFHFTHPRGINSNFESIEARKSSLKEFLRICKMSKKELQEEVNNWSI